MNNKTLSLIFVILAIVLVAFLFNQNAKKRADSVVVTDFASCAAAGNPIMESYPRQCRSKDGQLYTEYIGNVSDKEKMITLENPRPNAIISSGVDISGQARGGWYFEANFPVILNDANGKEIARSYATAKGEWMTEDFVPFSAELKFPKPETETGNLILEKSNPSGLPENLDSLVIPVRFK
jgi:hypothetical protein